ncbi:MAG: CHAT domain-containing tetratricopeptide repeat protein [Halieaceae bacterium]|nr:CHAT domain-containing tetratricopeptide repeat protein [Halieaceae bacterium]
MKNLCYASWSSEPARAADTAEVLQSLVIQSTAIFGAPQCIEAQAVADWAMGIAHLTRGEMAQAVERLDTATGAFSGLGDAGHAAQTQVPKIMALSMLGQYAAATECAERAGQAFIELGDMRSAGKVSLNLSALHERLGAYAEAARESRSAAVLFARVGDRELSVMADINTGNALTGLGDFDEALRIYARARMRAATHGFPVLEALVDESVALVHLARGQYHMSLAGFENSRRRYELLGMPQHLATAEKQLGDAYLELRLLPEASALFEQAIRHFERLNFPDEQAWTYVQLGRAQALLAQPESASVSFSRATDLFVQQGIGVGESTVSLARAELALSAGDPGLAQALAAQAAIGFGTTDLTDGSVRADVLRADAYLSAGKVEDASDLYDDTLGRARVMQLVTVQVRCLTGLGLAAQARGDLAAARTALGAAIELFEDQRRALPGDDLRSAFLSDHLRPYHALLQMSLQAHAASPCAALAAEVLFQLERVRARSLGERLSHSENSEHSEATRNLRDRLNWLYRLAQRREEEGESSQVLSQEARSVEMELLEQARRARMAVPASVKSPFGSGSTSAGDYTDGRVTIAALQALLGEADALVEYGVQGDELFACVLKPAGVTVHRNLASWSQVLDALRAARFQIETLGRGAATAHRHIQILTHRALIRMQQLHALVWAPIAPTLDTCHRLLVVPHGQLALLPFAALHDGSAALAERFELAVVPSAQLAMRGYLRQTLAPRQVFVLGESSRLPHAAEEANFIGSLFDDAKVFVGEQATLAAVQGHAGHASVVHLACHAQFRTDNPMFSALHLYDGALTVELAETLQLQPGLVVLSACETGLSEQSCGDEMVGLVRAFLVAGTARVLASAWPIDDQHTAQFMASFYRACSRGEAPAAALRHAQVKAMKDTPHPFYWAAFTLYGGF